ncbi:HD-domain/PDEase-like protein [Marasmius fiardii PR-910]|nr:HD-domain/PDEase-like protein [Marasmius fiardii PR-910]
MYDSSENNNPYHDNNDEPPFGDDRSPATSTTQRHLKDVIHDLIPLSIRICQFIDTPQFQRLREIKQLGTSSYVWPSASHSRFEHCIGVAHLARSLVENIRRSQPELKITNRDVECVEIAGLCHDLGHGPWSHVWDGSFIPSVLPEENWTHEQGSEMMLEYLVEDNRIEILPEDLKFIKALIRGDPTKCSPEEKRYLFDIVANQRNGLDVDKYDYIQRDSHMLGSPIKINVNRMLASARVIGDEITYNIKDLNKIKEVFRTRFQLHEHFYNHKTAKSVEYMLLDLLKSADAYMNIASRIRVPRNFLDLTEAILHEIKVSEQPELAPARKILARIVRRDLYKMTDWKLISYEKVDDFKRHITSQDIFDAIRKQFATTSRMNDEEVALEPSDIIVEFTTLHHGMKEKNPLDFVKFYSKYNPNNCGVAQPGDYSTIMSQSFAEVMMRVYTKKPEFFGVVQGGYRAVLHQFLDGFSATIPGSSPTETQPIMLVSPLSTEPPASPRPHASPSTESSSQVKPISKQGSDNKFMTVGPNYVPPSPARSSIKMRKRRLEMPAGGMPSIDVVFEARKKRKVDQEGSNDGGLSLTTDEEGGMTDG